MGEDYCYEIKLDGFRCLAFVDGEEIFLQSRNGRPLGRYFPELALPARPLRARRRDRRARRPTAARTSTRSASASTRRPRASSGSPSETPAVYVAFDLLAATTTRCSSCRSPSAARRSRSCSPGEGFAGAPVELMQTTAAAADAHGGGCRTPRARSPRSARRRTGPGERKGMVKVKRVRTIDAVVVGWRPGQGAGHRRRADPRPLRRRGAARRRALLGAHARRRSAGWSGFLAAYETGERGSRRPEPLERRQGARVDRAAPGARRGDRLRPRLRRAHPPRREAAPLARGQGPARLHVRAAAR